MPFVPDAEASAAPASGGFFEPDQEKSLAGFGENLVNDVKQTGSGLGSLAQGLAEHPIDTVVGAAKALPGQLLNEGKRLGGGELLSGHPIDAVEKFGNAFYDKPLTTGMEVAPVIGAAGRALGFGAEAADAAELAAQAPKAAEAAAPAAAKLAEAGAPEAAESGYYHVTHDPESVLKEGLVPDVGTTGETGEPGHVYLTKGLENAKRSLKTVQEGRVDALSEYEPHLLKVDLPKEIESALVPDPENPSTDFMYKGAIPPKHISRFDPAAGAQPAVAAPAVNPLDEVRSYIGGKANAAKEAATSQFSRQAQRPGWAGDVADYLQEKSQMMAHQQMGASPLQARQIGHEGMRAIGQYALDNDIVSPTNGLRGMKARNAELLNKAGETLGALRKEADALRDPAMTPVDVLQEVKARLDPKYTRGAHSGEAGQYAKALEDVEDAEPTFQGMSDVSTKLNKAANEANRLKQPHSAYTDVANAMSEINNERIKALLGPEKAAQYEQSLRAYGVNKKISSFLERKSAGEVKRMGPGSLTSNMVQKGLDEVGYRVGAKGLNKLSTAVIKNPALAKDLPGLFKEFIHHVDDVTDPGLAHGGIVADDELNDFLSSKYQNKGVIKK